MAKRGSGKWFDNVYTPNPQDKMVITFRKWISEKAGGGIPWENYHSSLPDPERDKQKLFDVWTTHTQDCMVCQNALKNINRLTKIVYVASIVCLGLGLFIDARKIAMKAATEAANLTLIPTTGLMWAVGSAILLALIGYLLGKFSKLFYIYEFDHSHND